MRKLKHELLELACWFGNLPRTKAQAVFSLLDEGKSKVRSVKVSLEKYYKEGYLEKIIENGETLFRITEDGRKRNVHNPLDVNPYSQRWDGYWRVIIYDIKEIRKMDREALRRKLIQKGFGCYQDSVWISPWEVTFEIERLIEHRHLEGQVFVLKTERLGIDDEKALVEKTWKLSKLNQTYQDFIKYYKQEEERIQKTLQDRQTKKAALGILADRAINEYKMILTIDPSIPSDLLPDDWLGIAVHKFCQKLSLYRRDVKEMLNTIAG